MIAADYLANQELQRLLHDFFSQPLQKRKYIDKLRIVNHLTMMVEFGIGVSRTTKRFCRKQFERDVEQISGTGQNDGVSETTQNRKKEFAYVVDIDKILSSASDAFEKERRSKNKVLVENSM